MDSNKYSGSFVAGALLHEEITAMLPLLMSSNRDVLVQQEIEQNIHLHIKYKSSRQRIMIEIVKRFDHETLDFWRYYQTLEYQEQLGMLFFVTLDTYKLLFDFHVEVTMTNWAEGKSSLSENYFQVFINNNISQHPELNEWTDKTIRKCISVYLTILRKVGLLQINSKRFTHINLSDEFYEYFVKNEEIWFLDACFLSKEKRDAIITKYLTKMKP